MNSEQTPHRNLVTLERERELWISGKTHVAGVDEAGRGPLAGPVVAAAVIFPPELFIPEVDDSKVLTGNAREALYTQILKSALAVGVGVIDHATIDEINILNATIKAMQAAIAQLSVLPDHILVDGNHFDGSSIPFTTIIDGDALCFSIAAASIVAKVTRDRLMTEYDTRFPGYGFAKHKGYATKEHREAIYRLGYCEIHRRSFELNTQLELEF
ncbi:MAG: ribonuclease [Bacteroidetes bacterium]|nr:ribonuclease [Bacteroidota bacterium]